MFISLSLSLSLYTRAVIFIPIPLPPKVLQTQNYTRFFCRCVLQIVSGTGMGMNATAQYSRVKTTLEDKVHINDRSCVHVNWMSRAFSLSLSLSISLKR